MAAPVNVQLRNAESALLFMQQEHAKTLQGLHQELQKLQKKCAELNFELAMKSGSPDQEDYEKQQKLLEDQLQKKTLECTAAQDDIKKREAQIGVLEQQAKAQERRRQEEVKQYQQQVAALTTELEQRSCSIAYLTTQLHQLKLRHQSRAGEEGGAVPGSERTSSPAPPKDKPHHVRRHKVRSSSSVGLENLKGPLRAVHTSNLDGSSLLDYAYTAEAPPQQYLVTARRSGSASPHHHGQAHPRTDIMDLRPFLAKSKKASCGPDVKRPTPPILPPIQPVEDRKRGILDKRAVLAKRAVHRSNPDFDQTAALETLAVEKVCSGENDLRHIEQSKTD